MTPAKFEQTMKDIALMKDINLVKQEGMSTIIKALGAGAPAYLPGLIVFMNRLEKEPGYTPKAPPRPLE